MLRRSCLLAALGLAAVVPAARAADYVPGEVVVRYAPSDGTTAKAASSAPRVKVVKVESVARATHRLRRHRNVLSAPPTYIARAT